MSRPVAPSTLETSVTTQGWQHSTNDVFGEEGLSRLPRRSEHPSLPGTLPPALRLLPRCPQALLRQAAASGNSGPPSRNRSPHLFDVASIVSHLCTVARGQARSVSGSPRRHPSSHGGGGGSSHVQLIPPVPPAV